MSRARVPANRAQRFPVLFLWGFGRLASATFSRPKSRIAPQPPVLAERLIHQINQLASSFPTMYHTCVWAVVLGGGHTRARPGDASRLAGQGEWTSSRAQPRPSQANETIAAKNYRGAWPSVSAVVWHHFRRSMAVVGPARPLFDFWSRPTSGRPGRPRAPLPVGLAPDSDSRRRAL